LPFVADEGEAVTLGKYFTGHKPVLLTVVYYNCPGLCNLHLNGVTEALKQMSMEPGNEFELVAVTMDHTETAAVASAKKTNYINQYGRPQTAGGWHFLTGSKESIEALTKSVGFNFKWDETSQQFAHASAAIIMTPGGAVSRYIHGIQPEPRNLKLALLEASDGKIGSIVDKLVMFCFQFDPKKSKYTIYAWNLMRVGVVLTVLIFAILMIPAWVRVKE
jgi:protein SCO1/2